MLALAQSHAQSSPPGRFSGSFTSSPRETYAGSVKDCLLNQNGGLSSDRYGETYANWASDFSRLAELEKQHFGVNGVVLQVDSEALNMGVGSFDTGEEKVEGCALIRSSLELTCQNVRLA